MTENLQFSALCWRGFPIILLIMEHKIRVNFTVTNRRQSSANSPVNLAQPLAIFSLLKRSRWRPRPLNWPEWPLVGRLATSCHCPSLTWPSRCQDVHTISLKTIRQVLKIYLIFRIFLLKAGLLDDRKEICESYNSRNVILTEKREHTLLKV